MAVGEVCVAREEGGLPEHVEEGGGGRKGREFAHRPVGDLGDDEHAGRVEALGLGRHFRLIPDALGRFPDLAARITATETFTDKHHLDVDALFPGRFTPRVAPRVLVIPEIADRPLAVLVDGGVNSAAEGLAGALKLAGRAKVIGEATAGNTEAIVPYCFPEGSMALVAVGVLAPLKGPTWEGRGVAPDLEADPEDALNAALRYLEGATPGKAKESR